MFQIRIDDQEPVEECAMDINRAQCYPDRVYFKGQQCFSRWVEESTDFLKKKYHLPCLWNLLLDSWRNWSLLFVRMDSLRKWTNGQCVWWRALPNVLCVDKTRELSNRLNLLGDSVLHKFHIDRGKIIGLDPFQITHEWWSSWYFIAIKLFYNSLYLYLLGILSSVNISQRIMSRLIALLYSNMRIQAIYPYEQRKLAIWWQKLKKKIIISMQIYLN